MPSLDLRTLRVDQIGSLQRPSTLKAAYARHLQGKLSVQDLHEAQDEAILEAITTQQAHGLPVLTDGEFRRVHFMESFGEVAGMEQWKSKLDAVIRALDDEADAANSRDILGIDPTLRTQRSVTSRLKLMRNRPLEEFEFAQTIASQPVKVTLLDTDRICQGYDPEGSRNFYADTSAFLDDVVSIEREMVKGLADAGCKYIQMDAPSYTRYVDAASLQVMHERGEDPQKNLAAAIRADNAVIEGFPKTVFGLHLCRGNRHSMWHREGSLDAIAEQIFTGVKHQRLLIEYDTERAGTFEPLRFVPKDKIVVLGLITTKTGTLETVDHLQRRIEAATKYLPLEQLALSPQCGFASDLRGNLISEEDQWRKLALMMETSRKVWG
ncbi:MAG: methionine synthase [Acidobacteria bacterium]|nr:methionine synthase [Acidobacteriota bacterium]